MPIYTVVSLEREVREVIHQVVAESKDAAIRAVKDGNDDAIFICSTHVETDEYLRTQSVTEIKHPESRSDDEN